MHSFSRQEAALDINGGVGGGCVTIETLVIPSSVVSPLCFLSSLDPLAPSAWFED